MPASGQALGALSDQEWEQAPMLVWGQVWEALSDQEWEQALMLVWEQAQESEVPWEFLSASGLGLEFMPEPASSYSHNFKLKL